MKQQVSNERSVQIVKNDSLRNGFTLIELIVVVCLISIMLFFSLPRFQDAVLSDSTKKTSLWIIGKVRTLKENAVSNQKLYTLHINLDTDKLWVTNEAMSEEELQDAELQGYELPDDVKALDVEYPDKGKISAGQADIRFYKKDYSDKVLIHIEDDDKELSFLIEPFLSKVKLYEKYAGFED